MALPRRGLDEVLGDPSFAPQEGKANAGELKQRLRSYAALLRAAVMPSSKSPFGRDFVGKVGIASAYYALLSPPNSPCP